MKNSARLISAFLVGAAAGSLLGMLLKSPADNKTKQLSKDPAGTGNSFFKRLFGKKTSSLVTADADDYEQA